MAAGKDRIKVIEHPYRFNNIHAHWEWFLKHTTKIEKILTSFGKLNSPSSGAKKQAISIWVPGVLHFYGLLKKKFFLILLGFSSECIIFVCKIHVFSHYYTYILNKVNKKNKKKW